MCQSTSLGRCTVLRCCLVSNNSRRFEYCVASALLDNNDFLSLCRLDDNCIEKNRKTKVYINRILITNLVLAKCGMTSNVRKGKPKTPNNAKVHYTASYPSKKHCSYQSNMRGNFGIEKKMAVVATATSLLQHK